MTLDFHALASVDIPFSVAQSAHAGTSFVPEQRAAQVIAEYAGTLQHDLERLERYATTDAKRLTLIAEFDVYRAGYRTRYLAMLHAKARCMSTMITGGSNFPTRRNACWIASADKRTDELIEFRERAIAAIRKKLTPELAPIMAGDTDAVSRIDSKLAQLEKLQARMVAANKAIRKHAKAGESAQLDALAALGVDEGTARELLTPDFCGRIGFADYMLKNNNANIRRLKQRGETIAEAKVAPLVQADGEHAKFEDDPGDNRVRLIFPGKPSAEVRARLKSCGFRWAPSVGAWQAYRNHRSIEAAKREAGIATERAA